MDEFNKKERLEIIEEPAINPPPMQTPIPPSQFTEQIQPTLPEVPTTIEISSPRPKKKFYVWIILLFLILAILAGFYAYKTQIVDNNLVQVETPTPIIVSAPTPNPTANWKIYTSTKYNFSVNYPPEWLIYGTSPGTGFTNINQTEKGIIIFMNKDNSIVPSVNIGVDTSDNQSRGNYLQWIENAKKNQYFKVLEESTLTINGIEMLVLEGTYTQSNTTLNQKTLLFQSKDGENFFSIGITDSQKQDYNGALNQILSSFKFLENLNQSQFPTSTP